MFEDILYWVGLFTSLFIACLIWTFGIIPTHRDIPTKGKVVLVTGGAAGIGRELVNLLLSHGCTVIALDIDRNGLEEIPKSSNLKTFHVNIRKSDEIQKVYDELERDGISVFAVANVAGIYRAPGSPPRLMQAIIEQDIDKDAMPVLDVNLLGPMRVNKVFFPMIKANKGCFAHVASVSGRVVMFGQSDVYAISKHGLMSYVDTLRRELDYFGIRVVCVEPGPVRTNLALAETDDVSRWDLSQTQLKNQYESFIWKIKWTKVDEPKYWQGPEAVAKVLFHNLFSSTIRNPHQVVDIISQKFMIYFLSVLPYPWQDFLLKGRA